MKLWGRFLSFFAIALLAGGSLSANAATTQLTGKVVDDLNRAVANTSVALSRGGATLATTKTSSSGSYAFNVDAGAYSLRFVPPTAANGTLNAYDIIAPQAKTMTVQLTKPMPGRAFLTGNLTTSPAMTLAADSTVYFGSSYATQVNSAGNYRLMPTAGTNDLFKIKAASIGSFSFSLYAQSKIAINQDTVANFVVPVVWQKVRVVNASGQPVVGAMVEAAQGAYGTDFAPFGTIEGLGAYNAGWKNRATTDAAGYVNIQTVKMTPNASAGYLVTAPASYRYLPQQFTKLTGAGEITLMLTNQVSQMSGVVRDQTGAGVGPIDIGFGEAWTTSSANGAYSKAIANGLQGNYSMYYRSGSFVAGGTGTYVSIAPALGAPKLTAVGGRTQDFTLKFDTVKVKVVDSIGNPVAKAHVQLTDNDGYALRGRYGLIAGQAASVATGSSNAPTDATGVATLKTLRLDAELQGIVTVTPAKGSALSWKSERAVIGAGTPITVVLARPTVTVSGKVSLSDGTAVAPYGITFADGRGGDQGTAVVDPATGAYSMQVPVGMKGFFFLTCPRDAESETRPFCMSFSGGGRTITTNTVVNIVIPTEKTPVHIVDPNGKGIASTSVRIWHSVGIGICTAAKANIFSDYPTLANSVVSNGITDANGWAIMTTVKLTAPCEANVNITPDSSSRYQSRTILLTISDDAANTIVLTITEPVIGSVIVATGATARTVTLIGDNFLGATSITWNSVDISTYKVVDKNRITFNLPSDALSTGSVVVTNGGGAASFTLN